MLRPDQPPCLGHISTEGAAVAAYQVWWTVGHIAEHGAEIDLICGRWGDGTSPSDRFVVRLHHFIAATGPWVMVQDASLADGLDRLAARAVRRADRAPQAGVAARLFRSAPWPDYLNPIARPDRSRSAIRPTCEPLSSSTAPFSLRSTMARAPTPTAAPAPTAP